MQRLITAVALLALAFYLVFLASNTAFLVAALVTGLLCYHEYSALVAAQNIPRPGWLGILSGTFILLAPQFPWTAAQFLPGLTLTVMLMFIAALRLPTLSDILPYVSSALLGAVYAFAPWRFAVELRAASVHLVFFALALNWAGDTAAFYVGRKLGKHRLAPIVSPKKSWEGAAASVAGSIVFGVLYLGHFLPGLAIWEVITMAAVGNIAGQFGDLAESAVKRGAGVKDSGSLLPGHGGVLDRLDSNLFALPVILLLYKLFTW
jgi:phosphatidate cytidylyltransferase